MSKTIVKTVILFTLIILISACGSAATAVPPTATSVPPLPTAVPPTVTPTDVPPTKVPPTDVPPTKVPPTAITVPTQTNVPTAVPPTSTPTLAVTLEQVASFDLPDSFVNTIAFSPDSQTMITGDRNGEVLAWERDTWERTTLAPARSSYAEDEAAEIWYWGALALAPDGSMIVNAYGDDGTVTGYDRTGQVMFTYSFGSRVWAVAISPNSKFLAVGGLQNNVVIFDLETLQPVTNLVSDYEYIFNLVFSPDGNTLLVGYERPGNVIKLWDTATWQETESFTHVTERIDYHDILFSPDGQQLAIASTEDDIEIKFIDLATKQIVKGFSEHVRASYQMAFSPDGSLLASASDDGTLRLWDMKTGSNVKTIRNSGEAGAVAFSPDGTLIAFSLWGKGVQVWAVSPAASNTSPTPAPPVAADDPDSTAITPDTAGQVKLLRKLDGHENRLYGLAFSPDGRFFGSYSLDGVAQVWDPATWQVIHEFTDSSATGWRLFFLADSAHVSSGSGTVWDIASGKVEHALGRGYRVTFSPDGVWMADNGGQLGIELWRIADWQVEREIVTSHRGDHLAFSSDSRLVASSGSDFAVKLSDVKTGQELYTLQGHQNIIHGLAFSPDGRWLASASMDTTVKIWDIQTGELVHTLQTAGELFDVTFSPDSSLVAAALNNKTVELWDVREPTRLSSSQAQSNDVASGQLVRTLNHDGEVVSVAFSPDGALLAAGAYDSKIYLWGIP